MDNDPRTRGFNYGPGWGSSLKPPLYYTAMKLARMLADIAGTAHDRAWGLEMAIRDVRLASLGTEKIIAVQRLETMMEQLTRSNVEVMNGHDAHQIAAR